MTILLISLKFLAKFRSTVTFILEGKISSESGRPPLKNNNGISRTQNNQESKCVVRVDRPCMKSLIAEVCVFLRLLEARLSAVVASQRPQ